MGLTEDDLFRGYGVKLPKAYLRLDPNIDQTHPDVEGFIRLLCAANRQPQRGFFKSRALVEGIVGKARTKRFLERGDLTEHVGGRLYVEGWEEWQEGDITVGERQRRIKAKRDSGVIPPLPKPLPDRDPPSIRRDVETLRRIDVKTRDDISALEERGIAATPRRVAVLDEILERHDVSGPTWAANIIRNAIGDPFLAVMAADKQWQREQRDRADAVDQTWQATKAAEPRHPTLPQGKPA